MPVLTTYVGGPRFRGVPPGATDEALPLPLEGVDGASVGFEDADGVIERFFEGGVAVAAASMPFRLRAGPTVGTAFELLSIYSRTTRSCQSYSPISAA